MMLILAAAMVLATPDKPTFPEQMPGLMEACFANAVAVGEVIDTDESHKYICVGDAAGQLWAFLEDEKISSFEQDTPEGRWLSRVFPLGGCFKRTRLPDGKAATNGLSCTIWVPRPVGSPASER